MGTKTKIDYYDLIFIISQIFAYILAIIIVIQIIKIIFGGSWATEDVILALVVLNITLTFGLWGYLFRVNSNLNSKIASVDKKLHGHIEWHRGVDKVRDR